MGPAKVAIWILNLPLDFDIEQILIPQESRKYHPNSIFFLCRLLSEEQNLYFSEGLSTFTKMCLLIVDSLSGALRLLSYFAAKYMYFSYDIFMFPIGNRCVCDDTITFPSQKHNSLKKPKLDNFWFKASRIFSLDCLSLLSTTASQQIYYSDPLLWIRYLRTQ